MCVGGSLKFCNTSGGSEKFYSYSRGITKNLQNLRNFQRPLPVKNDTSPIRFGEAGQNEQPSNNIALLTG